MGVLFCALERQKRKKLMTRRIMVDEPGWDIFMKIWRRLLIGELW